MADMAQSVIVWDLETVPDLRGFARNEETLMKPDRPFAVADPANAEPCSEDLYSPANRAFVNAAISWISTRSGNGGMVILRIVNAPRNGRQRSAPRN
jgi:hypothetical protein